MAHEIETMAFVGQIPWHKLGSPVTEQDAYSSEHVLNASGLNWRVAMEPVFQCAPGLMMHGAPLPDPVEIRGFKAITRNSDRKVFAVVKDSYKPIQNADCFRLFDSAAKDGHLRYETAMSLYGGRVVAVTATLPGVMKVRGDKSEIQRYLLLHTSHDGSRALGIGITPTRVVCANTLNIALRGMQSQIAVRHTSGASDRLAAAGEALAKASDAYKAWNERANVLASTRYSEAQLEAMTTELFRPRKSDVDGIIDAEQVEVLSSQAEKSVAKIAELYEAGAGIDGDVRGTAWGAINAVAEYADHHTRVLSINEGKDVNRVQSIFFGRASRLKQRAYEIVETQIVGGSPSTALATYAA